MRKVRQLTGAKLPDCEYNRSLFLSISYFYARINVLSDLISHGLDVQSPAYPSDLPATSLLLFLDPVPAFKLIEDKYCFVVSPHSLCTLNALLWDLNIFLKDPTGFAPPFRTLKCPVDKASILVESPCTSNSFIFRNSYHYDNARTLSSLSHLYKERANALVPNSTSTPAA